MHQSSYFGRRCEIYIVDQNLSNFKQSQLRNKNWHIQRCFQSPWRQNREDSYFKILKHWVTSSCPRSLLTLCKNTLSDSLWNLCVLNMYLPFCLNFKTIWRVKPYQQGTEYNNNNNNSNNRICDYYRIWLYSVW